MKTLHGICSLETASLPDATPGHRPLVGSVRTVNVALVPSRRPTMNVNFSEVSTAVSTVQYYGIFSSSPVPFPGLFSTEGSLHGLDS